MSYTPSKYKFYIERNITWRWVLKIQKGRILCTSPNFSTRSEALNDLEAVSQDLHVCLDAEIAAK